VDLYNETRVSRIMRVNYREAKVLS
jgi:hypothetical protein